MEQSDLLQNEARFWSHVDQSGGPDACWPWMLGRYRAGYGKIKIARKTLKAHRIAYALMHNGIPDGMMVCHTCDNPPCCNPKHLFLGTGLDNQRDAMAKGRKASGDRHGSHLHPERLARGDKSGPHLHPERMACGERNGAYTHPERRARGDRNGSRLHPESRPRGDNHYAHLHPETRQGINNGHAKLTEQDVLQIRALYASGISVNNLMAQFAIGRSNVRRIINRQNWKHI